MINVSIAGGSGYSGTELLRILTRRDDVTVRQITAHSAAGSRVSELYPEFSGHTDRRYASLEDLNSSDIDLLFISLPSGEAMDVVPLLADTDVKIIDLGGDFRLPKGDIYEYYYGKNHSAPQLLGKAVYGLPELNRSFIGEASLIANPGCYPTSIILALYPFLRENIIQTRGIVINSLSGVSGAGRKASLSLSFAELNENVYAYKVTRHQHIPEIQTVLATATGMDVSFSFVPHLIPITRGIYTTILANLNTEADEPLLNAILTDYYRNEPFVRIVNAIPQVKNVSNTNFCDIYCTMQETTGQIIIISVIDNLLKGAAGQAVQNMNIMFNLPETRGLL